MKDYTKALPEHTEKYVGVHDLFVEIYTGKESADATMDLSRPPLLFIHGAFTGSWMWSKSIPHYVHEGWTCYVMNLRSHYKSRVQDLTQITFEDYLDDIQTLHQVIVAECGELPILIGFSMGGILSQKLAETIPVAGLVLIDSVISREVFEAVPYVSLEPRIESPVLPAPERVERASIDESEQDIAFQRKYLSMESSQALNALMFSPESQGISVNSAKISCPSLVIKAVNSEEDDQRGRVTAEHLRADYAGLWNTSHTGLLVGQRYLEVVTHILDWLRSSRW